MVTTQKIILSGEIRSSDRALIDEHGVLTQEGRDRIEQAARETVKRLGYEQTGLHWKTAEFQNNLHAQSAHIAQGVDESGNKDEGAGDQGREEERRVGLEGVRTIRYRQSRDH